MHAHRPAREAAWRLPVQACLALAALCAPAAADTLVTQDGRVLECKKARESEQGYTLTFEHGVIEVPRALVAEVAIEGDMSDYVPKDEDEKKKLADGFVKYRGKWMSKAAYQAELNRLNEERRVRLEDRQLHTKFANAWVKETKHFVLRTNTSEELLEYYADLLEAYYDLMDKRLGIDPSPTLKRTKMTVNIYKSRDEFHELSAADIGPSVAGYFWSHDQTLNFYHDYQEPSITEWVSLHECTHLLTYLLDPQFDCSANSIWVNEGVADLFGSADITRDKRGKLMITPGKLQTDRVLTVQQAIKDGNDTKLDQLLNLKRDDFDAFQYAHAWSFFYFLNQSSPAYEKAFKGFFKDLYSLQVEEVNQERGGDKSGVKKTVPVGEVRRLLLKKLGAKDTAGLEKEWKDFIAGIAIEAPEARFKRAYSNLLRGGLGGDPEGRDKAVEETLADLDFALENGFKDPRAYWARGQLKAYFVGNFGGALEDLKQAIELDPLNPAYRFDMGRVLCGGLFLLASASPETGGGGGPRLMGSSAELDEARSQFGLACELDRENDLYSETFEAYCSLYEKQRSK